MIGYEIALFLFAGLLAMGILAFFIVWISGMAKHEPMDFSMWDAYIHKHNLYDKIEDELKRTVGEKKAAKMMDKYIYRDKLPKL